MTKKTAGAMVLLCLGASTILGARHWRRPAATPQERLERAAQARFERRPPRIVMPDGTTHAMDEQQARGARVDLFTTVLASEAEKKDPSLRRRAEDDVRERAPMSIVLEWEDASGARSIELVANDTRNCGLAPGESRLEATAVAEHACLLVPRARNRWDDDATVTVKAIPLTDGDRTWPGLVRRRIKEIAAEAYLTSPGG